MAKTLEIRDFLAVENVKRFFSGFLDAKGGDAFEWNDFGVQPKVSVGGGESWGRSRGGDEGEVDDGLVGDDEGDAERAGGVVMDTGDFGDFEGG